MLKYNDNVSLPTIPANFLIANPSIGDAKDDATRFLMAHSTLMSQSSVDRVHTRFQTGMAIYRQIPSWMMMPLFIICLVFGIVIALPLFIVFVRLFKKKDELMCLSSLVSLGWIVAVLSIFV